MVRVCFYWVGNLPTVRWKWWKGEGPDQMGSVPYGCWRQDVMCHSASPAEQRLLGKFSLGSGVDEGDGDAVRAWVLRRTGVPAVAAGWAGWQSGSEQTGPGARLWNEEPDWAWARPHWEQRGWGLASRFSKIKSPLWTEPKALVLEGQEKPEPALCRHKERCCGTSPVLEQHPWPSECWAFLDG